MPGNLLSSAGLERRQPGGLIRQCQSPHGANRSSSVISEPPKEVWPSRVGRRVVALVLAGLLVMTAALGVTACGAFQGLAGQGDDPWRELRIGDVPAIPQRVWTTSLAGEMESIGHILDVGNDRILVEVRRGNSLHVKSVDVLLLDLESGEVIWRMRVAEGDEGRRTLQPIFEEKKTGVFGAALWDDRGVSLVLLSSEDGQIVEIWEPSFLTMGVFGDEFITVSKPDEHDELVVNEYLTHDLQRGPISTYSFQESWGSGLCIGEKALVFGQITEGSPSSGCYAYGPASAVERQTGQRLAWAETAGLGKRFYPLDDGAMRVVVDPISGATTISLFDRDGSEIRQYLSEKRLLGYRMSDDKMYVLTEQYLAALELSTLSSLWQIDVSEMGPSHIAGIIPGNVLVATANEIVWVDSTNGNQIQVSKTRANIADSFLDIVAISRNQVVFKRGGQSTIVDEIVAYGMKGELLWTMAVSPSQQLSVLGGRLLIVDSTDGSIGRLG